MPTVDVNAQALRDLFSVAFLAAMDAPGFGWKDPNAAHRSVLVAVDPEGVTVAGTNTARAGVTMLRQPTGVTISAHLPPKTMRLVRRAIRDAAGVLQLVFTENPANPEQAESLSIVDAADGTVLLDEVECPWQPKYPPIFTIFRDDQPTKESSVLVHGDVFADIGRICATQPQKRRDGVCPVDEELRFSIREKTPGSEVWLLVAEGHSVVSPVSWRYMTSLVGVDKEHSPSNKGSRI